MTEISRRCKGRGLTVASPGEKTEPQTTTPVPVKIDTGLPDSTSWKHIRK